MGNDRLRAAREATASPQRPGQTMSRRELADAIRGWLLDHGIDRGIDESYVGRLERGNIAWPHNDYRSALRAVLDVARDEDLGFAPPVRRPGRPRSGTELATLGLTNRLELLRQDLDEVIGTGAPTAATLGDWEQLAVRHGYASRDLPAGDLLAQLADDLLELKAALAACRTAAALGRLTRVAAQMAGLMLLTLVKLDDRGGFHRWARTARIAAGEAGDPALQSWVLGQEAYGHYYAGDHVYAITVARQAQEAGRHQRCVGVPLAAALEARAHAAVGAAAEARLALQRAEATLDQLLPEDFAPSALGYNEAQLRFHAGSVYTRLGDWRAAEAAHDRALELCAPGDYTDWALTRLDRAACLAATSDVVAAVDYTAATFGNLSAAQRAGIIARRGQEIVAGLPATEQARPAVVELQELMAAPT